MNGIRTTGLVFFMLILFNSCGIPLGNKVDGNVSDSYYFQPVTGNIIYSPEGNWLERAYENLNADAESFKPLSNNTGKDKNVVFYKYYRQPLVDVASFKVDGNVMKDKKFVYSVSDNKLIPIAGADPGTFMYLAPDSTNTLVWARDKSSYYMKDSRVNVDYRSFHIINENIFCDKDSIYIEDGRGIKGVAVSEGTLHAINQFYAKSQNSIYYYGYQKYGTMAFEKNYF